MASEKKLFLLDALALIYRAHFAFSKFPRMTSTGMNTSAVFGFTNTLLDVINKEKPSHLAVVFDTIAPTERHIEFEGYKANREAMPEDLVIAIPYIKELIAAFNIPTIAIDGYEADDVIGTLSKKAEAQGFTTYMMTPDKDFAQLVSDNTFIYKPGRKGNEVEILGVPEVLKKWEIKNVDQVIDILALWGDAVDNIPGIPGIGEKTAKKLISEYDSVEGLIDHTEELKGKQKENVIEFAEQGLMSKRLATIICDIDLELDEEEYRLKTPDKEKIQALFAKLEFRTLGKRVFGEEFAVSTTTEKAISSNGHVKEDKKNKQVDLFAQAESQSSDIIDNAQEIIEVNLKTIEDVKHKYLLIDDATKRARLIADLQKQKRFCFDTETTALNANAADIVGLSISFKSHEAYYVPIPEKKEQAENILNEFKEVFESDSIEKIGQNIKYDIIILKYYGIEVKGKIFDTMIAHYLLAPEMRHNMNVLSETYLGYSPVSIETLIGKKGKDQGSMRDVPIEQIVDYASEDADITYQLWENFHPQIKEKGIEKLFDEIEIPLIHALAEMEKEGIKIDVESLKEYSKELEVDIKKYEKEIYLDSGEEFNIASPKQLGIVLFEKLKLEEKPKKTKSGQYATNEEVLSRLASKHQIIQKILDFRGLQKLKSTYVDALPNMVIERTNKIHSSFNQTIAITGRLSSQDPNLQNIPIRTEKGREVRKAFVPRSDEFTLLSADYSQIELRIIADISDDQGMQEAFINNEDIHTATASKVYDVAPEKVDDNMRRNAKTVNFGIIYGISAFGLSQRLNIKRAEAKHIIDQYFAKYSNIQKYMVETIQFAKENGYVETIMGRRRYLRDINSQNATVRGFAERNAINSPIQGSAADMIKIAMINIHKDFQEREFKSKMILQVHDELIFDVHKEELELIKPIVEDRMKNAIKMKVPIEVEMGTGDNWLEAH
ncbi:MAG: DNA polymerase I [Bacteroidia bacterium]|nr:DNA polymerase I [Bacteroidia bacterium]